MEETPKETPKERHARRKARQSGQTAEQLRREEDEAFDKALRGIKREERLAEQYVQHQRLLQEAREAAATAEQKHRDRTAKATETVRAKGDQHRRRAAELRAEGLTVPRIGIRMAHEEQRSEPYDSRQVRKWLAPKKG